MSELVHIIHPDLPRAPASVQARDAFEQTFKAKGWVQVSEDEATAHNTAIADGKTSPFARKAAKSGGEG